MISSKTIGHYSLGQKLGTGTFAKVRVATHTQTKVEVAVKIINKKMMKQKKMVAKIKRQIRFLRCLNHPNVIKLYEVLENTTDIFIIMELASRGQFYDLIVKEGTFCQAKARFYFKQMIRGVEFCHQNLIAHRDLKPENILVSENGTLKIADFGLSNVMKNGKFLKTPCGSLVYASPQIIANKQYEGTATDIWSLGVILYLMTTGTFPFEDQHQMVLKSRIMNGEYKMPADISPQLKDLLARTFIVDSEQRIRMDDIKKHPWIRQHLPIYAKIISSFLPNQDSTFRPHQQILEQVLQHNYKLPANGQKESMFKAIKRKEDMSFVVAYRLLEDEYNRKSNNIRKTSSDDYMHLFKQVNNKLGTQTYTRPRRVWTLGRQFKTKARTLAKHVISILQLLKIAYKAKTSEYRFKCSYRNQTILTQEYTRSRNDSEELTAEDITQEHQGDRYSKMEVAFDIQIYGVSSELQVLDIYLYNGHPMVFLKYVDVFLQLLSLSAQQ